MKTFLLAAASLFGLFAAVPVLADEGMWTFDNFPAAKMQAKYGWAPDQAWLDHARLSSLRLAQGCSASFVAPDGLVMTNHHCARECIDGLSTPTHDYIVKGFYAAEPADEKKCPALEANQLIGITDVTKTIQSATSGMTGKAFADTERAAIAAQEKGCGASADIRCEVVTLYNGGVYDLYKYRRYQDLRLVWAAEDGAANFGGDPDNFNYPRYAIDASFVRIYDHGKPLASPDYLKFAPAGPRDGDIAISSGNPGRTEREYTVSQLQFDRDYVYPTIIPLFSELRGVIAEYGARGPEPLRTSLTDRFFIENSLKAFKGMDKSLLEGSLVADKTREEADLRHKVAADPKLAAADGGAWDAIDRAVEHNRAIFTRQLLLERGLAGRASDLLRYAVELNRYAAESAKPDGQRLKEYTDSNFPALQQDVLSPAPLFADFEKVKIAWWLTKVREYLGADDPDVHAILGKQSPEQIAAQIVDGTKLRDAKIRAGLLSGRAAAIDASQDPLLVFARRIDGPARAVRADFENNVKSVLTQNATLISGAKFALFGTSVYPDATFTARLSYGTVAGYTQNGAAIAPFTNFGGAFARATGAAPFKLPDSWARAQSVIGDATTLDFITTNDIVGGNSGSPIVNKDGQAIGLIFDGNIQSLGGDYGYDGSVNRAVAVDLDGMRTALGKIYHADRLVRDLAQ